MSTLLLTTTFAQITCYKCHLVFAVPERFDNDRRRDHGGFWCPAGHQQWYSGKSTEEKLRDQLTLEKHRLEQKEAEANRLRQRVDAEIRGGGRMSERPILMSAPMVRALLDGTKSQTRRIVKPQPDGRKPVMVCNIRRGGLAWNGAKYDSVECPYGDPSDTLWVRETHALVPATAYRRSDRVHQISNPTDSYEACIYREGWERSSGGIRWRPSIHMPRWASRLTLTITDVRVQRVQEISEADARAEGVAEYARVALGEPDAFTAYGQFAFLWDSINGVGAWERNDWVWALTFDVAGRP